MINTLLPKEDQALPDFFTLTVNYLTGRKEIIDVANFQYIEAIEMYEIWTKDNLMKVIPRNAIESIDYDKNWSKIIEIKAKLDREKQEVKI